MKFSILFVFCAFLVTREASGGITLPKEIVDLMLNLSEVCKKETGVANELVNEIRKGKLSDDPKAKCYLKCIMRQLQAMTEDGDLDMDLIEGTMPEELKQHGGLETVKKCKHIKESDMCDTAYKLIMCFQTEDPSLASLFE